MRVKTVTISCLFKEIHSKVNKLHRLWLYCKRKTTTYGFAEIDPLFSEIRKLKDDVIEVPSAIIDTELSCASQMVEQAAARIREILANARNQLTGNELKVHEDILANCNQLMDFILKLIQQSDILQKEIVEHGRVSHSDFWFHFQVNFRVLDLPRIFTIETRDGQKVCSLLPKRLDCEHRHWQIMQINVSKAPGILIHSLLPG